MSAFCLCFRGDGAAAEIIGLGATKTIAGDDLDVTDYDHADEPATDCKMP